MTSRRRFLAAAAIGPLIPAACLDGAAAGLDPKGKIHIPIGIPNTLDTLKTFVEREGNFSPGLGTYGIYFWVADDRGRLYAPTMGEVTYGFDPPGLLTPWTRWHAGDIEVTTEVCEVERPSPAGPVYVVAARARLMNAGADARRITLYVALRPLGAAGGDVRELRADRIRSALLIDEHPAIVAERPPSQMGVLETDSIGDVAASGRTLTGDRVDSPTGDCSGAMRFDLTLGPNQHESVGILCPVLAGRSAARHEWVDLKQNAMVDAATLNPTQGGIPEPDPGTDYYRSLHTGALFDEARAYWRQFTGRIDVRMPDPRWGESMRAILAHAALCMNEGAPDVAVANYGVFNRDGMYIANIMQKAGLARYSEQVIDYFIHHPFNGRAYPEADNPGQILWAIEQHWLLTRDQNWLQRVYPSVEKIVRLIQYCRSTPPPHWVDPGGLDFGDAVPLGRRRELVAGRCDGSHPEYTEAFDVAGLRGAADLAAAMGHALQAAEWRQLAEALFAAYDERFGSHLATQYGSYCVLWPGRLYPLDHGKAYEQFRNITAQPPTSWRYFPLATAHQGLLAGSREAGFGTINLHLAHEQMRGWYALDEGGGSGSGTWYRTRTNWPHSKERPGDNLAVAMPHGWAIAEFWLLVRDSIAFEDGNSLVLFGGVPPQWFQAQEGTIAKGIATCFGVLNVSYMSVPGGAELQIRGTAPPAGYLLRLPSGLRARASIGGEPLQVNSDGGCRLPADATRVRLHWQ